MKWTKRFAVILAAVCCLCGCTKSNIISPEAPSDVVPVGEDGIVWSQLWDDFQDKYDDSDAYPFVESVSASFFDDENTVKFFILTNEEVSGEEVAAFATDVVKGLNDLIADQNPDYALSSDESYGGYLSQYDIYVMASEDSQKADKANWILEDTIPAGEYRPVDPNAVPSAE